MKDSEVKIGMTVRIPDELKNGQPTTSIVTVKRVYMKDYEGRIVYEVEGKATDRFRREYRWVTQRHAEDMELVNLDEEN